jgi:thymidylate synthase (FAD)
MKPTMFEIESKPFFTQQGTPYMKTPGVSMLSYPSFDFNSMATFCNGFDESLGFNDFVAGSEFGELHSAEKLCKTAGQLCYMSLGPKRTKDSDAEKYFDNILSSGHGSVLEHANFSLLLYGISRSMTHEIVRHRAGFAYSQVSQRYVDGKVLRFVERPEYQDNEILHSTFEDRIDLLSKEYDHVALVLGEKMGDELNGLSNTEKRKRVNQAARSVLPNETEAPIICTANVRAWRHFLNMRGSKFAEVEVRKLAVFVHRVLMKRASLLFGDFTEVTLDDGTTGFTTPYPKV